MIGPLDNHPFYDRLNGPAQTYIPVDSKICDPTPDGIQVGSASMCGERDSRPIHFVSPEKRNQTTSELYAIAADPNRGGFSI
jgi:hypothetical protein